MKSKRILFYHDDADGRCAAAIARKHAKEMGWQRAYAAFHYGDLINWQIFENYKPGDSVWILDFTFKDKEMEKVCDIVGINNIVWIDHHETAKDLYEKYSHLKGIRKIGEAACYLTWNYCFPIMKTPKAAALIGDRDLWEFEFGDETKHFYETFLLEDNTDPWREIWDHWLDPKYLCENEISGGKLIYKARMKWLKDMAKRLGRENERFVPGAATLTVNFPGSGDMGHIIQDMGYLIAHCYEDKPNSDGKVVRLNYLYSETIDVGEIAKAFGGGGHKEAAGWEEEVFWVENYKEPKNWPGKWIQNFTPPTEDYPEK